MALSRRQAQAAARTNSDIRLHGNGYYNDDTGQFFLFTDDGSGSVLATDPRSPFANQFDSEGNIDGAGGATFGGGADFYVDDSGNINVRALNQNPGYGTGGPLGDVFRDPIQSITENPLAASIVNPALAWPGIAENSGISQQQAIDAATLGAANPAAILPGLAVDEGVANKAVDHLATGVAAGAINPALAIPGLIAGSDKVEDAANSVVDTVTEGFAGGGDPYAGAFQTSPERQELIDYGMDFLRSNDPLTPDLSDKTNSYIDALFQRGQTGSPLIDQAQGQLQGLYGQQDPSSGFYQDVMQGNIGQNDPGMQTVNQMQNRVGGSGVNSYMNALGSRVGTDPSLSGLSQLYGQAGANPALSQLSKFSSGEYLGSNPWLDSMFDKANKGLTRGFEDAMRNTNQSFIGSGMTKSTAYDDAADRNRDALLDAQTDLATGLYGGAYDTGMGQMLNATGALGNLHQGVTGQQRGILGDASGIFGRDTGVLGNIANMGLGQYNIDTNTLGNIGQMQSGMYGDAFGRQASGAAGASNVYNRDFNNQLGAINAAFPFSDEEYRNIGAMGQAGGIIDTHNMNRARDPMIKMGAVNPLVPMPAMTQPTQGGNPFFSGVGGAMAGWGATGSPWGMIPGFVAGWGSGGGF